MSFSCEVELLEKCCVSPPPYSVSPVSLPLTFFDIPWLLCMSMERIFFYEFPYSTSHFMGAILPDLKHSLSLALQQFFPFAGTLVCPATPSKPHISCKEGASVELTIAEASGEFSRLLSDSPKDVTGVHPFVPDLQHSYASEDQLVEYFPLLALQLTIFPNSGICIGVRFRHVVADGRSLSHFIQSWASIFRSGGDLACLESSQPLHDRNVVSDPCGLEGIFLDQWWACRAHLKPDFIAPDIFKDKLRATFQMNLFDINRMKDWISKPCQKNSILSPSRSHHVSTFVAVCAWVWVCLVKSRAHASVVRDSNQDDQPCHLSFVADYRNRYDSHIPKAYFGNCLVICFLSVNRRELVREDGVRIAANAIKYRIKELEDEALKGAEKWLLQWEKLSKEYLVTVAGSPKLNVYETDFGWGKPKKTEVVQTDRSGAIALAESRDGEGGVEVGLALSRAEMEAFISMFKKTREMIHC